MRLANSHKDKATAREQFAQLDTPARRQIDTAVCVIQKKKKKDKMEDAAAPSRAGEFITAAIQTAGADSARVKGTGGISGLKSAR